MKKKNQSGKKVSFSTWIKVQGGKKLQIVKRSCSLNRYYRVTIQSTSAFIGHPKVVEIRCRRINPVTTNTTSIISNLVKTLAKVVAAESSSSCTQPIVTINQSKLSLAHAIATLSWLFFFKLFCFTIEFWGFTI